MMNAAKIIKAAKTPIKLDITKKVPWNVDFSGPARETNQGNSTVQVRGSSSGGMGRGNNYR